MLSTVDNPYDPNTDYEQWLAWDHEHGYYTQEYLARVASVDENQSDEAYQMVIKIAIQQIIDNDSLGIYVIK